MSADNGIYILETTDNQYRITHAQAIENIFKDYWNNKYDLKELIRYFGDCKFTSSKEKALSIAHDLASKTYTEYGVKMFSINMKWGTVYNKGTQEINEYIKNRKDEFFVDIYKNALSRAKSMNEINFKKTTTN